MSTVRTVTDRDFSDCVLGAAGPVLVGFQHGPADHPEPGDGPDLLDLLDHVAGELPWLTCVRHDVARWPRAARNSHVTATPALVLFERGVAVLHVDGRQPPATVCAVLAGLVPQQG